MRRSQPQDDAARRARDAELRQIRSATAALRGLAAAVGSGGGVIGALGTIGGVGGAIGAGALGVVSELVGEMRRIQDRSRRETGTIIAAQIASGGTSRDITQTAGEFRAIGLDTGRIADLADQFRERVFSDPIAIGAFGRQVLPERLGGTESSIAVLREGINRLGRESTEAGRRVLAARFQLKELLPLFDIPSEQRERLLRNTEAQAGAIDPELRRLRAERETLRTRREIAEERIAQERERRALGPIKTLEEMQAQDAELRADGGIIGRWMKRRGAQGAAGGAPAEAQNQTQAVQENTKALYNLKDEFANSRRASGAVPAGLRGMALQEALNEMGALPYWLGAYSQH